MPSPPAARMTACLGRDRDLAPHLQQVVVVVDGGDQRARAVGVNPDDRAAECDVHPRVRLQPRPVLVANTRWRRSRHGAVREAGIDGLLEVDELGLVIEDGRSLLPVRQELRSADRPFHADRGIVEIELAKRRAPSGPDVRRPAERAHPMSVPVLAPVVPVADRVRQLRPGVVLVTRLENQHALLAVSERQGKADAGGP